MLSRFGNRIGTNHLLTNFLASRSVLYLLETPKHLVFSKGVSGVFKRYEIATFAVIEFIVN